MLKCLWRKGFIKYRLIINAMYGLTGPLVKPLLFSASTLRKGEEADNIGYSPSFQCFLKWQEPGGYCFGQFSGQSWWRKSLRCYFKGDKVACRKAEETEFHFHMKGLESTWQRDSGDGALKLRFRMAHKDVCIVFTGPCLRFIWFQVQGSLEYTDTVLGNERTCQLIFNGSHFLE